MNAKAAKRLRRDLRAAVVPDVGEDNALGEALVARYGTVKLAREYRRLMAREAQRHGETSE